jgi:hypothetical protein
MTREDLFADLAVPNPCTAQTWEEMQGNDKKRHCSLCKRNVYDLSAMTRSEGERLLAQPGDLCVRFCQREDGAILTSDGPVGRQEKRRRSHAGFWVALATSLAAAFACALGLVPSASSAEESTVNQDTHRGTVIKHGVRKTPEPDAGM